MRKRERDRYVKKLQKLLDDLNQQAVYQLQGSIWYFDNNAEGKGFSFAYGASEWAVETGKQIKKFLDEELAKQRK